MVNPLKIHSLRCLTGKGDRFCKRLSLAANNTFTNCIGGDTQVIGNPDALIGVADVFGFENTEVSPTFDNSQSLQYC